MSSGNFEIGEDLSMKGFNEYIRPSLEKYKAKITDIMDYNAGNYRKILVSLIGDSAQDSLESVVKISLMEAHSILHDKEIKNTNEAKSAWAHQIKTYEGEKYKTIGLYKNNETASKVFQSLALEYSAKSLEATLDETKTNIKSLGERFSLL